MIAKSSPEIQPWQVISLYNSVTNTQTRNLDIPPKKHLRNRVFSFLIASQSALREEAYQVTLHKKKKEKKNVDKDNHTRQLNKRSNKDPNYRHAYIKAAETHLAPIW